MFDPNHNAHANYYLVHGDLAGSWQGLDKDIIIVPWAYEMRAQTLQWFSGLGNRMLIAGYYDANPAQVNGWLEAAKGFDGILGVMYTTWEQQYGDLEKFSENISKFH